VRDPVKAVQLYRKACDAGDPIGCSYLGRAHADGVGGLARDPAKAAQLYASACDAGSGSACSLLAEACRSGTGVGRDITARGGTPLSGGSGTGQFRFSALSSDYSDGGPDIMAVN